MRDIVKLELKSLCPKNVRWSVFSVAYRKIVENQTTAEGRTVIEWDLKDTQGKPVAPGLYYIVVIPEGESRQVRSVVVYH